MIKKSPLRRLVRQLADQSPILGTTITLDRLRKRAYAALLAYYVTFAPHLNEPSRKMRDGPDQRYGTNSERFSL